LREFGSAARGRGVREAHAASVLLRVRILAVDDWCGSAMLRRAIVTVVKGRKEVR